jgi:hypothetical protein
MQNSPYLDKPLVPLAVELRSMLGVIDAIGQLSNTTPAGPVH